MNIAGKPEIIDIFFLILFLRITYIAISRGLLREICKIVGLLGAVFFAFHFYSNLAGILKTKISFINPTYLDFVSFFLIFIVIKVVFSLLNLIISLFLPKEEISGRKRVVLLGMGVFRSLFLFSTIFFLLQLSSFKPNYFKNSLSYNLSKNISAKFYLMAGKIINKFNNNFKINEEIEKHLQKEEPSKKESIKT
ncbi:MAG: CvpA family protein [Candidatus Omnitrophica bacterium]|nr:CvpA family protein [Candidatus Omnitrophota bacterium]